VNENKATTTTTALTTITPALKNDLNQSEEKK
jgi:hypothetical protein